MVLGVASDVVRNEFNLKNVRDFEIRSHVCGRNDFSKIVVHCSSRVDIELVNSAIREQVSSKDYDIRFSSVAPSKKADFAVHYKVYDE